VSHLQKVREDKIMIYKKERTLDLYKEAGAEMRLFMALADILVLHISQVLLAPDTDKFLRAIQKIDEVRSRAEDNMFHDHPEISNEYLDVFYGNFIEKPRNAVDEEIRALAKEKTDELFKRETD
jgi:pterin-4a-carbinolamine dehydratase